jgi:hypothetical protein
MVINRRANRRMTFCLIFREDREIDTMRHSIMGSVAETLEEVARSNLKGCATIEIIVGEAVAVL